MRSQTTVKIRMASAAFALICSAATCGAQELARGVAAPARDSARVTTADAAALVDRIKGVESPTFRAYLYAHVSAFLLARAGKDAALKRAAADAASAGLSDVEKNFDDIPDAMARGFAEELLGIVSKLDADEAGRLRREHTKLFPAPAGSEDAGASFQSALNRLDKPETSRQGLDEAVRLIESGKVSPVNLQGAVIRLSQANSPALPQLLSAALTLEEQRHGALPLQAMHFLSYFFLKETNPPELRARFIGAAIRATQLGPEELRATPSPLTWAVQLLRAVVPVSQKLTPELYPLAAARLAALAPGGSPADDVFNRVKNSDDPLASAISEADSTSDERLKGELLKWAAQLAKERGRLRQAVDLITSTDENRAGMPEGYSARDEFLVGVLQEALGQKDPETAAYAASKVAQPVNTAVAWRRIARYYKQAGDQRAATEKLDEAAKLLKDAPEGRQKAIVYLGLAADYLELDTVRASHTATDAIKAANSVPRPREKKEGEMSWSLFPVADAATKTFQQFASKDRGAALSLADTFQPKEFRVAALLGVYGSQQ